MAKDGKFGTFGGVFTPSILTILGVIMYLRLPWVVGNAGLYAALGIILVAHVISVSTGLSISSIATDKKVGAGGPYYIVSRSLGLPIGGTLGLALFIGLAFSVSLYVIGFSESFLGFVHVPRTLNAIRIAGTITIVALTIVTFISTAFAIKTQYLILLLIALSLASIFFGPHHAQAAAGLGQIQGSPSLAVLFGVFFPAVTGFTAGVNMSGDLRDPKKSIPRGTMAAIAVGLVVYVGLAVFLAFRVPAKKLASDPDLLLHVALFAPFVVAGIWGATLSSALGSILGAPRILQALSADHIGPRWFARGYGKTNEPRNALLLAFAIAEGGILIAKLDAIARVVSMVFLATYGFLNLCCAIESWASPDFRPSFRIPRSVSVIGAITSLLVMIELDLLAMAGAVALMAGLFFYLERKQLELEAGDAWAGIWSSLIRSGLARLSRETERLRNWRPTVLAFHEAGDPEHARQRRVTAALIAGNGIATDFELSAPRSGEAALDKAVAETDDDSRVGLFSRRLPAYDAFEAVESVCRYHGFAALRPNTVLLPWSFGRRDSSRFARLLDVGHDLGLSVLVYALTERDVPGTSRIDVWWRAGAGNLAFAVALMRFVTRAPDYERAGLRLLLASTDSADNDYLRTSARRILRENRIEAAIRIVDVSDRDHPFEARVRQESMDAGLVVLGLPNDPAETAAHLGGSTDRLVEELADVLLVRASPEFEEGITLGRPAAVSFVPPALESGQRELPAVQIPETPDLARLVTEAVDSEQQRATRLFERGIQRVYAAHVELIRGIQAAIDRHFSPFERALPGQDPDQLRHAAHRAESALLLECREQFEHFEQKQLAEQTAQLSACIDAYLSDAQNSIGYDEIEVMRSRKDFVPRREDTPYVRRFKRRRRLFSWLSKGDIKYRIPAGRLLRYYRHKAVVEVLTKAVARLERETHRMMIHLGKIVASSVSSSAEPSELAGALAEHERRLGERLGELVQRAKERMGVEQWSLLVGARALSAEYAEDVVRLDLRPLVKRSRRVPKGAGLERQALGEVPERWREHQRALIGRAVLGVELCTFQQRFRSIVQRNNEAVLLELQNGVLNDCERLLRALAALKSALGNGGRNRLRLDARIDPSRRFEPKQVIDNLVREVTEPIAELPEIVQTLTDESIQRLEEGRFEEVEPTELPVRRLAQFLVESELIGTLEDKLGQLPQLEQRAASVGQDVLRLVSFQIAEAQSSSDGIVLEQLRAVVESSAERLNGELEHLRASLPEVARTFDEQLKVVLESTSAWDLAGRVANLEQHIRLRQGKIAVSGVRGVLRRAATGARQAAVDLIYRRSAGVLLARRLQAEVAPESAVVDRVRAFVRDNAPSPEVLESLPFYYRQLFAGQSAVSEAFWVGREAELGKARHVVESLGDGAGGALLITGARGSGKTALCHRIASDLGQRGRVHRIVPLAGGSIELAAFDAALQKATELSGSAAEITGALPDGTTLVIDDLELWWERSAGGLAVIQRIAELVDMQGRRCRFVLSVSRPALNLIDRLSALSDRAVGVVQCAPMPALSLKSVVTLRHASSGMKFELDSKHEDSLGELGLAQLFSRHFDYSGGAVGPALRSWLTHVTKVEGDTLTLRPPRKDRWEAIDELKTSSVAMLLQFVLHKQLTRPRLGRVTQLSARALDRDVDTLRRMKLVVEGSQGVLELNPFVQHVLIQRFSERGLLT